MKTLPQIQLRSDFVLLKMLPPADKTESGVLFIPKTANQNKPGFEGALAKHQKRAVVVATGPGRLGDDGCLYPCNVVPGDTVVLGYMSEYDDGPKWPTPDHKIIPEKFIHAVIE